MSHLEVEPEHAAGSGAEDLVTAVLTASRVLVAVSARSLSELDESITVPQFRMLVVLAMRGESNLNMMAADLGVNPSTAMRMVDRLISAGMVARQHDPADRRQVKLSLSDQGREVVTAVTERRRAEIARIVSAMPTEHRAELAGALQAFADAAGEPAVQGPADRIIW